MSSCFQHSPEGALLASTYYTYYDTRVLNTSSNGKFSELKTLVEKQAVESEDRKKLLEEAPAVPLPDAASQEQPTAFVADVESPDDFEKWGPGSEAS